MDVVSEQLDNEVVMQIQSVCFPVVIAQRLQGILWGDLPNIFEVIPGKDVMRVSRHIDG